MHKKEGGMLSWWRSRVRENPKLVYALYAVFGIAAVLFYLIGSYAAGGILLPMGSIRTEIRSEAGESRDALEQRLIEVLSKIRGAGRVDVLVTYETNGEIVTATIRQTDEDVRDANDTGGSETSRSVREVIEPATVETENGHAAPREYSS